MSLNVEQQEMIERAIFGEEVHNFINSTIGQYIVKRAESEEQEALKKLRTCDPENAGKIREYQNEAAVAEHIVTWLKEAIQDGVKALQIIESRE
jgi:hypothetical protein